MLPFFFVSFVMLQKRKFSLLNYYSIHLVIESQSFV